MSSVGSVRSFVPSDEELVIIDIEEDEAVLLPSQNEISPSDWFEHAIGLDAHKFIPNYFSSYPKVEDSLCLTLEGRNIFVYGMKESDCEKEFEDGFQGLIEPVIHNHELLIVADEYLKGHPHLKRLEDRWKVSRDFFKGEYTTMEFFYFYLGEEFCKRILPKLNTHWCLKSDRVPRFRELVLFYLENALKSGCKNQIEFARGLQETFQEDKDYFFEDIFLPRLLPILNPPLRPWPRIETIKQELRRYFLYENLLKKVTPEMDGFLEKKLAHGKAAEMGRELERAWSYQYKKKIIDNYGLSDWDLKGEEEETFIEYLSLFLSAEDQMLTKPIAFIESSVSEEILEYIQNIDQSYEPKPYISPGSNILNKIILLLDPIANELIQICGKDRLERFISDIDLNPNAKHGFELTPCLEHKFNEFLQYFIENHHVALIMEDPMMNESDFRREYLSTLQESAKTTLAKVCDAANLRIVFKQQGREVFLGSFSKKEEDIKPDLLDENLFSESCTYSDY